jgi:hypothetical protein
MNYLQMCQNKQKNIAIIVLVTFIMIVMVTSGQFCTSCLMNYAFNIFTFCWTCSWTLRTWNIIFHSLIHWKFIHLSLGRHISDFVNPLPYGLSLLRTILNQSGSWFQNTKIERLIQSTLVISKSSGPSKKYRDNEMSR